MFGSKSSSSSSQATGAAQSGGGSFAPVTRIYMNGKPLIDFTNPVEILTAAGLVLVAWYAWRKFK